METHELALDKGSATPLWRQLRNELLSRIIVGEWREGTQLPTEEALCKMLGVSRITIRTAVDSLVREGLIIRTRGKGSFIAKVPLLYKPGTMGFYRTMGARGRVVRSKVLTSEVIPASADMAKELNIKAGDELLHILRLRYMDDRVVSLANSYLIYDKVRGIENEDLASGSLWAKVEHKIGQQVAESKYTYYAVLTTAEEAQQMDIPLGSPLLRFTGPSYLANGDAFEWADVKMLCGRDLAEVRYMFSFA